MKGAADTCVNGSFLRQEHFLLNGSPSIAQSLLIIFPSTTQTIES